jgi:DNA-binding NarL/FixJ family response regulator
MPDSPTVAERNLLQRMADGSTDESIARRLGISDRQVRRRIARLLQRLGVSSRFAAGAEAVRRGWL